MTGALAGKRILLVEDEYFIASDLKRALNREGADVLGPVAMLDEGLKLAEQPIDAAVLDVNLEGCFSYPIADRLAALGTPFMFLTGYDDWSLPDAYKGCPRVAKPFGMKAVFEMLESLVAAPDSVSTVATG